MIPPVSEMPVAAPMRRTTRTVAATLPVKPARRRTCGNCFRAEPCGNECIICRRDGRGFDNHPIPNQTFPADRGGCMHHQWRNLETL